ncbi:MAG TPA: alpha/beta hydrolase [Candidatus Fimimorpha faecalis]|uniref:Alpha/beta hydrolase n=1 Tax=Candidatus Fimimorpha faecalis TaxID=2840824 RepID=A0A9D1ECW0_9FIRM|nr:alpha/beta hydrolase [Candidatus Fimimorpha faecalis]
MKEERFAYLSADGKTTIHGVFWIPDSTALAVLQISHGMTEYAQRYRDLAEFFTKHGYIVAVNDVIGHGESVIPGEEPMHMEKWEHAVKDCETCRKKMKALYPQLPYYMMGFSLGSFILQSHQVDYPNTADALIFAGTGRIPSVQLKIAKRFVRHVAKKAGINRTDPRIHELSFGTYNKHFASEKGEFSWLYTNKSCMKAYTKDKNRGNDMTCGFFYQFLSGMEYVNQHRKSLKIGVPVLLISGLQDPVGNFGKGVKKLYRQYKKMGIQVNLKLISGYRHDIFHDACKKKVQKYILHWLPKENVF